MIFRATVSVWLKDGVLDPAGETVRDALHGLDVAASDVRLGKLVRLSLDAANADEARAKVEDACRRLLANPVLERFEIDVQ